MSRRAGEEHEAGLLNDAFVVSINDASKFRVTGTSIVSTVQYDSASLSVPILSGASANATATIGDKQHVVFADPGSTEMGLTLPAAAGAVGKSYTVKKISGTTDVLLSGASPELVDGNAFVTLESANTTVTVTSDGVNWHVTGLFSASQTVW